MTRRALLVAGVLSSLLYTAMLIVIPSQWPGYDSAAQAISELSAIGAPTRSLWTAPGAVYTMLVTAFGVGVWLAAGASRRLRITGVLVGVYGALGLLWPLAPMHLREVIAVGGATRSDTAHLVLASVTVALMLAAMTAASSAFGVLFRGYSLVSLLTLAILPAVDAPAPANAAALAYPAPGDMLAPVRRPGGAAPGADAAEIRERTRRLAAAAARRSSACADAAALGLAVTRLREEFMIGRGTVTWIREAQQQWLVANSQCESAIASEQWAETALGIATTAAASSND